MKKYRLKKSYPSLYEDIEEGIEVEYKDGWIYYVNTRGNKTCVEFDEYEFNFTDFWELIEEEKPLFITEDGVEIVFISQEFWVVNKEDFRKRMCTVLGDEVIKNWWVFAHESSADEYIWRNKKVFSYNDLRSWDINGGTQEEALKVAKERSKE